MDLDAPGRIGCLDREVSVVGALRGNWGHGFLLLSWPLGRIESAVTGPGVSSSGGPLLVWIPALERIVAQKSLPVSEFPERHVPSLAGRSK